MNRPPRPRGRAKRVAQALGLSALMLVGTVPFMTPPATALVTPISIHNRPHVMFNFQNLDQLVLTGYTASDTPVKVEAIRNAVLNADGTVSGTIIGTAFASSFDNAGNLQVNHPGGNCWVTTTPNIQPGDVLRATTAGGVVDATTSMSVIVTTGATIVAGAGGPSATVKVHGTAKDLTGAPLPVGSVEDRVISGKVLFDKNGRRDLRSTKDGTFAYDAPGSINWTATYSGLDTHDQNLIASADNRVLWLGVNPAALVENTTNVFFSTGSPPPPGGPVPPCSAPLARFSVTSSTPAAINAANVGGALTLTGASQDASAVSATVSDGTITVGPVAGTLSAPAGAQTWTATFAAGSLTGLANGPLTAAGSYATAGGLIGGNTLTITKDTVVPPAPTATPPAGTYAGTQSVTLNEAKAGATIHFTVDGSTPTAASPAFSTQIVVSSSQTINAVAVDPAGNVSPVGTFAYLIGTVTPTFSPASVTFPGSTLTGSTSATQTVTVGNTGNLPLNITGVTLGGANPAEFTITADTCTNASVATGGGCHIDVAFSPAAGGAAGARNAAILVADNAPTSPQSVGLSATATIPTPTAVLSPATLADFGSVLPGNSTPPQTITITNGGNAALTITGVTVGGANPADFPLASNTCSGATVAAGGTASCSIGVTFAPTVPGARSASLSVTDNAANSPQTVALTGTGQTPVAGPSFSPASVAFASQLVGTTSGAQSVSVSNTGTGPLTIGTVALAGTNPGDFSITADGCSGHTIPVGATTCIVSVAFAPAATGPRGASLSIPNNGGPGSLQSVALSGTGVAPAVSLSAPLAFGNQVVGTTSAPLTVTLTNSGSANLAITSTAVSAPFVKGTDNCSGVANLVPNASCTVSVSFAPTATGPVAGSVTFTDTAANSPQTLGLSGNGTAPAAGVSAAGLTYANQLVGTTSAPQTVTVANTGTANLHIATAALGGLNAADFVTSADTCTAAVVAPGATCSVSVAFAPKATAGRSASLTFTDDAAPGTQVVTLNGTGIAPAASLSATALTYANQGVGTASPAQTVTVSNPGTAALVVSSAAKGGANPADFTVTADTCTGATVAPGATCSVSLTFTPTLGGARSASLIFTDNAGTQTVTLSGTGLAPVASLSAASLTFAAQLVNTASPGQTVTLTNTGNAGLVISSIVVGGTNPADFVQTGTCAAGTIAAAGSCTVTISFQPAAPGARSATITITDNSGNVAGSTQAIALSGTGTAPAATVTPASLAFSAGLLQTSANQSITVRNSGTATLTIGSRTLSGPNAGSFTIVAASTTCNAGTAVAVGATCVIQVNFHPGINLGHQTATVVIADNAFANPSQSVALGGN